MSSYCSIFGRNILGRLGFEFIWCVISNELKILVIMGKYLLYIPGGAENQSV
jgi:hypothetical protein